MKNKDRPVYPVFNSGGSVTEIDSYLSQRGAFYLTKREYFASMAMQSMCAFGNYDIKEEMIRRSICFADELLKQLES